MPTATIERPDTTPHNAAAEKLEAEILAIQEDLEIVDRFVADVAAREAEIKQQLAGARLQEQSITRVVTMCETLLGQAKRRHEEATRAKHLAENNLSCAMDAELTRRRPQVDQRDEVLRTQRDFRSTPETNAANVAIDRAEVLLKATGELLDAALRTVSSDVLDVLQRRIASKRAIIRDLAGELESLCLPLTLRQQMHTQINNRRTQLAAL